MRACVCCVRGCASVWVWVYVCVVCVCGARPGCYLLACLQWLTHGCSPSTATQLCVCPAVLIKHAPPPSRTHTGAEPGGCVYHAPPDCFSRWPLVVFLCFTLVKMCCADDRPTIPSSFFSLSFLLFVLRRTPRELCVCVYVCLYVTRSVREPSRFLLVCNSVSK